MIKKLLAASCIASAPYGGNLSKPIEVASPRWNEHVKKVVIDEAELRGPRLVKRVSVMHAAIKPDLLGAGSDFGGLIGHEGDSGQIRQGQPIPRGYEPIIPIVLGVRLDCPCGAYRHYEGAVGAVSSGWRLSACNDYNISTLYNCRTPARIFECKIDFRKLIDLRVISVAHLTEGWRHEVQPRPFKPLNQPELGSGNLSRLVGGTSGLLSIVRTVSDQVELPNKERGLTATNNNKSPSENRYRLPARHAPKGFVVFLLVSGLLSFLVTLSFVGIVYGEEGHGEDEPQQAKTSNGSPHPRPNDDYKSSS